ncbi:MutS-related protein [Desertivirga arenae]|uniref:MutS-related protein n=1 Tax=Desertivirga arenae TaxID=2810309 RepID=UPI001A96AFB2|nr:hypothetical protein [Pedobacter sp. SYSU D00823]
MTFEIDQETYRDLDIFSNGTAKSIFSILDKTRTKGAQFKLHKLMQAPTGDREVLNARQDCIRFLSVRQFDFDISYHQLELIEDYISLNRRCLGNNMIDALYDRLNYYFNPTQEYYNIISGIRELLSLISTLLEFLKISIQQEIPDILKARLDKVSMLTSDPVLLKNLKRVKPITCFDLNYLDNFFRKEKKIVIKEVIEMSYEIDIYLCLAGLITSGDWCLPDYVAGKSEVYFKDLFHPAIVNPVRNNFSIGENINLIFLTGPNMAGKSSIMKALAISIYLAHLGFPVPAKELQLPIFKGLITTINLPDNTQEGLSHFYNEAVRLRKTADLLLSKGELFVVFDELFRGTNLKDALDATLSLTSILSKIKNSKFVISSHFTEVVQSLQQNENISFLYLDCKFIKNNPVFSFKVKEGVSEERLGMYILRNEMIFSKLEQAVNA